MIQEHIALTNCYHPLQLAASNICLPVNKLMQTAQVPANNFFFAEYPQCALSPRRRDGAHGYFLEYSVKELVFDSFLPF